MHTEAIQYSVSAAILSPTQRLFRSLDANADGQVTSYEVKTSGVLLPKAQVAASSEATQGEGASSQDTLSDSASRFQYFLQMMTQRADKSAPKSTPKPVEANPYQSLADKAASVSSASAVA